MGIMRKLMRAAPAIGFKVAVTSAMLEAALKAAYDCVVIGGGIRLPPKKLGPVRDGGEHHSQGGAEHSGLLQHTTRRRRRRGRPST
jgi:hypothetical protein